MKFDSSLPNYDWDQVLPIGVTTEQLYQAFKARLMEEVRPAFRVHDEGSLDPHTEWFLTDGASPPADRAGG